MTANPTPLPPTSKALFAWPSTAPGTFELEWREMFDSVCESLSIEEPDADRLAACLHLLRHLAHTEVRKVW